MTDTETAWIITRDGRPTFGRYDTEDDALRALLKRQGQSTDWAMTHEGWGVEAVPRDGWSEAEARELRATSLRMFADHGHPWTFADKDDEKLTRENCGACALAGYGGTREEGINYAGWERCYVQAGRAVGPRFRRAFEAGLRDDSSPGYLRALLMDLRTFGTPSGVTESTVREIIGES